MTYKIDIYQTASGKKPFTEWLSKIEDRRTRSIIRLRLDRLEMGNFGRCEPVGEGIYELKIAHGPGYRIYLARIGLKYVLLLCAGDKSSQKRDIEKAKDYFKDYKLRGENNE